MTYVNINFKRGKRRKLPECFQLGAVEEINRIKLQFISIKTEMSLKH